MSRCCRDVVGDVVILLVQMNHSPLDMGETGFAEFCAKDFFLYLRGILNIYLIIIARTN